MTKKTDLAVVICFCAAVLLLSLLFFILPDRDFSDTENRALAQAPQLDAERFFSGAFAEDINGYFADQFPARDAFVGAKALFELALGKGENNGVIVGSDGSLSVRLFDAYKSRLSRTADTDYYFSSNVTLQISAVNSLGDSLDIPLVTVIPPRRIDAAEGSMLYRSPSGEALFSQLSDGFSESAGYVPLLTEMSERFASGEYVYCRTDHHWTTLGAYYAYCDIMSALGKEASVIAREDFSVESTENFLGTTDARAGYPFSDPDTLELWTLPDEDEYTVIADGTDIGGFYNRDYLAQRDKYSAFLDGTHGIVTITKNGCERETLLVAKDSFANCLIPFLAREYDIVAVNLSSGNTDLSSLAKEYGCHAVLIIYNAENVVTTGTLGNLK